MWCSITLWFMSFFCSETVVCLAHWKALKLIIYVTDVGFEDFYDSGCLKCLLFVYDTVLWWVGTNSITDENIASIDRQFYPEDRGSQFILNISDFYTHKPSVCLQLMACPLFYVVFEHISRAHGKCYNKSKFVKNEHARYTFGRYDR
jgi:hypothetical protein